MKLNFNSNFFFKFIYLLSCFGLIKFLKFNFLYLIHLISEIWMCKGFYFSDLMRHHCLSLYSWVIHFHFLLLWSVILYHPSFWWRDSWLIVLVFCCLILWCFIRLLPFHCWIGYRWFIGRARLRESECCCFLRSHLVIVGFITVDVITDIFLRTIDDFLVLFIQQILFYR